MKLIAQRPCSFGGKQFPIGSEIPSELVSSPRMQEIMGILSIVPDGSEPVQASPEPVTVNVLPVSLHSKDGDINLNLAADGLQAFVDVLTASATSAVEIINGINSDDLLILIHATDSRKSVQAAAEARAKALNQEAGEQ